MTYQLTMERNEYLAVNDGVKLRNFTERDIDFDEGKVVLGLG